MSYTRGLNEPPKPGPEPSPSRQEIAEDLIVGQRIAREPYPEQGDVLDNMQRRVREVNEANGWFDTDRTIGDDVALLCTEVGEAFDAYRKHGLSDATESDQDLFDGGGRFIRTVPAKPEGFGAELADVLIRLFDTAERRGVDLNFEFERKLAHNKTRGYRHGGRLI